MPGFQVFLMVLGGLLALAGVAVVAPVVWHRRSGGGGWSAAVAARVGGYVTCALLVFVAGAVLMVLPFLLPVPVGGWDRGEAPAPPAQPTAQAHPTPAATVAPATRTPTAAPPPASGPTAARPTVAPPPASTPPSAADLSGRWVHSSGSVELAETSPGRFAYRGFNTQGALIAEGVAVRSGSVLTVTGSVPAFGLTFSGELQVVSGSLLQGTLRDPFGNTTPIVLNR